MHELKDISIVVPLYNEDESLPELVSWIERVMNEHNLTYEIVMVDDGSTDRSWEVIQELHQKNPHIIGLSFRRNYGKAAGLNVGFEYYRPDEMIDNYELHINLLIIKKKAQPKPALRV